MALYSLVIQSMMNYDIEEFFLVYVAAESLNQTYCFLIVGLHDVGFDQLEDSE